MPLRRGMVLATVVASILLGRAFEAAAFDNPKAKGSPPAKPQRISDGESLPAPPALVGMLIISEQDSQVGDGQPAARSFPTTCTDIERLTDYASQKLGIRYRYVTVALEDFSWDPVQLPLLYVTGWTPLPQLSDEVLQKLRQYLNDGGTLVVHAQCGRAEFVDSTRRQLGRLFPKRQLAMLDADSPVFSSYFRITEMRFRKDDQPFNTIAPYLEAIHIGCRPAVIFSPIDLNCGWDVAGRPIQGGILYHQQDGLALGVNIITCALANLKYARAFAAEKTYHQQEEKTRDRMVIGRVVHNGDWDPTPHGLGNLMKFIAANTALDVQFRRVPVGLAEAKASDHPVLYMTGLRGFKLSEAEVANLRTYLHSGGVLVADAAAGSSGFDVAFRREMQRVLPEAKLSAIASDSPLYAEPFSIGQVDYTEAVKAADGDLNAPTLEGISIDGSPAVIYSRLSLGNGWEQLSYPYNRGYCDADALRLGVNILVYATGQ